MSFKSFIVPVTLQSYKAMVFHHHRADPEAWILSSPLCSTEIVIALPHSPIFVSLRCRTVSGLARLGKEEIISYNSIPNWKTIRSVFIHRYYQIHISAVTASYSKL